MKNVHLLSAGAAMFLAHKVAGNCEEGIDAYDEGELGIVSSYIILVIYAIEWFVLLFPNTVPLARPASSLLGAMLCLTVTQIGNEFGLDAFNAFCFIDYDTLALLFGLMLIVVMIDDSGILLIIEMSLESESRWWCITKICAVAAVLSAVVMNDTICLFFTGPVIETCRKNKLITDPFPYLVALASNTNIGSALTMTGNPQNAMIGSIASSDGMTYANFLISMTAPCIVAWFVNWICVLIWYRHSLGIFGASAEVAPEDEGKPVIGLTEEEEKARRDTMQETGMYKAFLCFGIVLMVVGFFVGINVAGLATGFGTVFMCVRTVRYSRSKAKRRDWELVDKISERYLMQVDWPLLVMFTGLFIMISCLVQTGFPEDFFDWMFQECVDDPMSDCPVMFAIVIIAFSNIISNVPLILLIKPFLQGMEPEETARGNWFYISWVCTIAGNFILLGSAANLIVADQARKMGFDVLTTIQHGKFGIPSTLCCCVIGIPLLIMTVQ